MEKQGVNSFELMERAGSAFVNNFVLRSALKENASIFVFCGRGNNGGDGLVIARLLHELSFGEIFVCIVPLPMNTTSGFNQNFARLPHILKRTSVIVDNLEMIPDFASGDIIIDAIFGTGFRAGLEGFIPELFIKLNESEATIWSVDIPSGLDADKSTNGRSIVADNTITFELPKLSFFLNENSARIGNLEIVSIGLCKAFYAETSSDFHFTTQVDAKHLLKRRLADSSKSTYGHALIIAGAYGKVGAAVLSTRSCLRAGAGLVTAFVPSCAYEIMQISAPEAMVITDENSRTITRLPSMEKFSAVGMGPGIGTSVETHEVLKAIIMENGNLPVVIDADALNLLSQDKGLLGKLPAKTILTPHVGEFERLFGKCNDSFERLTLQRKKSIEHQIVIVLKGSNTSISTPDGSVYFNVNGNPGMATGGSGDVLTGILTALLAQQYSTTEAAILGTYLHGHSGDICSRKTGEEALIAGDIIKNLGKAFQSLYDSEYNA